MENEDIKKVIKDSLRIEITIAGIQQGRRLYAYVDITGRTMYQIWE
ncbi:MAG: hypothetical protein GY775_16910 [Candidatus Scalindua sp.]|nr:hypothetical protein [Candidatus Scalindua sp.]